MQTIDPSLTTWPPAAIYAVSIAALVLVLLVVWIWAKGRRLPGEHVFVASRLTRGNRIFPAQVVISPASLTLYVPQWIGKLEESVHISHVASVKIDTGIMFADLRIETSGGQDPVVCHGHTKGDAVEMKALLERFQTELHRQT